MSGRLFDDTMTIIMLDEMMSHRLRRCPNIDPTYIRYNERLVFAGLLLPGHAY